jgi:hypothetical protein
MDKRKTETHDRACGSADIAIPEGAGQSPKTIAQPDANNANLDKFALRPASLPTCPVIPEGQAGAEAAFGAWKTLGHSGRKI